MTRYDLKAAALLIAALAVVLVAMGYVIGAMVAERRVAEPPTADAQFSPHQPQTNSTTSDRLPWYDDIYVNDFADVLPPDAETALRDQLRTLRNRTGIEMTLLTIGSMQDYGHTGEIEPFATKVFNAWGVGDAAQNNGVLILVAPQDRTMRIALGGGWPETANATAQRVIDTSFLPYFRDDQYQIGLERGTRAAITEFGGYVPGTEGKTTVEQGWAVAAHKVRQAGLIAWGGLAGLAVAAWAGVRRYLRVRPRICTACGSPMRRLSEAEEDIHLDTGQQMEEAMKTVDYDVWDCTSAICGNRLALSNRGLGKQSKSCPACGYRTLVSRSTVSVPATRHRTGLRDISHRCKHCDHAFSEQKVIPRLRDDDDTGRGGGRSSGGGASGSW